VGVTVGVGATGDEKNRLGAGVLPAASAVAALASANRTTTSIEPPARQVVVLHKVFIISFPSCSACYEVYRLGVKVDPIISQNCINAGYRRITNPLASSAFINRAGEIAWEGYSLETFYRFLVSLSKTVFGIERILPQNRNLRGE
jgi:hypothetical protein